MGLDKLFQLFFGAIGLFDQQQLDKEARELNIERHEAGLEEIRNLQQRVTPAINELVSTTSAGYRRREQDIMKGLEGYGQQELVDIDEAFREQGERIGANLSTRGLSGTTIGGAMRTGLQREQQDARGSALQRHQDIIAGYGSRLSGERLQAQERLGLLGPTFDQSMTSQYLNWLGQRQDVPGQSPWLVGQQMLGSIFAPEPKEPEGPEWWEVAGSFVPSLGFNIGG